MCGGGGGSPSVPAIPAPTPIPQPSNVSPQATEGQRASKISNLKRGILSTVKTAPFGITGTGSNLIPSDPGKKALGA